MSIHDPDDALPVDQPLTVHLSPMKRKHLKTVMRIENEVYPKPWTMSLFLSELSLRANRDYTVAQVGSLVVGYSGVMYMGDDAHVANVAVDPLWHKHQVATRLMLHNVRMALRQGSKHITLEVRVSNDAAIGLYRKFGMAPAGVRKNYYAETNEDALVMWANDIDSDDYAMRMSALEASVVGATISEVPK